jgi:putative protease
MTFSHDAPCVAGTSALNFGSQPLPELVAPAGDGDCARAAVENGADAVYFGLASGLNARARAANFADDELPRLVAFLHRRGVKAYLALNTLIFPNELEDFERKARQALAAGVDAVLVQDFGAARILQALSPDWPIHASTQMSLTSAECLRVARSLGIRRVVLPRELSLADIAQVSAANQADHLPPVEWEAFVHGALCVAYSGQCLASASLGGRSANRGQCAQACRLPYRLLCDGKEVDLGDRKYLLSPRDLAAHDLVPQLLAAGVSAFKIEGRLKTADYVAAAVRHYRRAIDSAIAGHPIEFTRQEIEDLEMTFSRGLSHGWLDGHDHPSLVPGRSSANRGVLLGEVRGVRLGRVCVALAASVQRGDGVVFEGPGTDHAEQGGRVYEVLRDGRPVGKPVASGIVELAFRYGAIDLGRLVVGQRIWKTDDPELTRRLRMTYAGAEAKRRVDLDLVVEAAPGAPMRIEGRAASGATCRVESPQPLAEAAKHPLSAEILRAQLGRLGHTVYRLRTLDARIHGRPMVPLSVLGSMRREMVRQLDAAAMRPAERHVTPQPVVARLLAETVLRAEACSSAGPLAPERGASRLHVLCRSLEHLEAALAAGVNHAIADFADFRQYRKAVDAARAAGAALLLATPRIQKPGETGWFGEVLRHQPDGVLVRNLAGLAFFHEHGMFAVADFSLHAANALSAGWLVEQGAGRVTASYDLDRVQLLDLAGATPPGQLEVVVHQHMPMFHTEHCVFCAVLSRGTDRSDCGRPCRRYEVRLGDHLGAQHLLRADAGCRNTLFHALPQSAAEIVPSLIARGVRDFRVELLDGADESPAQLIGLYRDLLAGRTTGHEAWNRLKAVCRAGLLRAAR